MKNTASLNACYPGICYYRAELKMVREIPQLTGREQPTIAIITSLFCEKLAVDAMIDEKVTFVKYKTEGEYLHTVFLRLVLFFLLFSSLFFFLVVLFCESRIVPKKRIRPLLVLFGFEVRTCFIYFFFTFYENRIVPQNFFLDTYFLFLNIVKRPCLKQEI